MLLRDLIFTGVVSPADLATMSVGEVDKLSQADVLLGHEPAGADGAAHNEDGKLEAVPTIATKQEAEPMEA